MKKLAVLLLIAICAGSLAMAAPAHKAKVIKVKKLGKIAKKTVMPTAAAPVTTPVK
ncbi:MAG: hypothetical protein PHG97_07565 [Candidatus Margulisbacteria bacterium]|nr:hypothetical protein [Candidatus Margulisiibacteriota bacterium]